MPLRTLDDLYLSMPWDSIDAVVFDVGGILIDMSPQDVLAHLFPDQQDKYPDLLRKMIRTPYWNMVDSGALSLEEAIDAMTGRDEALRPMIHAFMTRWPEFNFSVEEGVEAVHTCKEHGKKLYILSNYPDEHFAYNERKFPFLTLFDGIVVSAREHMLKPKPDIYRLLTQRYALSPSRVLFIDDTPANIEGAFAAGWQGFCMNQPGKLRTFLGS